MTTDTHRNHHDHRFSMPSSLRRTVRTLALAAFVSAALPAVAAASTWTVDDDKVQCPNAGFTTIQAAIDQAAPWDTVRICDGTYREVSAATTATNSPAQSGSKNGLTITKPLTLKGAGASKVFIEPAASAGTTLAGTVPYLRDGGGAVIQINRQSGGSSDFTENFVDISGVTVRSPSIYAEAGIAFFNTSGRVSNSTVGPLYRSADATELATKPHGYGIVMTNFLQGASEAAVRREVTVQNSLVTGYQSGGILFDDGRLADGNAANNVRSGIIEYGTVTNTRVVGSGPDAVIPQTGIRYHAGARGAVTGSEITGNSYTPNPRASVGLLLTDANTGNDPSNPTVRAFKATGNSFTGNGYGLFNADITNAGVRLGAPAAATGTGLGDENWWGCAAGPNIGAPSSTETGCDGVSGADTAAAASVELGLARTIAPDALTVPAATVDTAPIGAWVTPSEEETLLTGVTTTTAVAASDDFGVASVSATLDGNPLGSRTRAPYEFDVTPVKADIGATHTLVATIVDSSGQTVTSTRTFTVASSDKTAPVTTDDVPTGWVPAAVPVTLTATDAGDSGLVATHYTAGVNPENPTTSSPVYDPGSKPVLAGGERIRYFSIDGAGNAEAVKTSPALQVDGAAPVTSATPAAGLVATPVVLTLTATDDVSGVAFTEYRIDGGSWTTYAAPVPVSLGEHAIEYRSTDVAGNAETAKSLAVDVRDPAAARPAIDVTAVSATLEGLIGPGVTHYEFLYRKNGVTDWTGSGKTPVAGTDPVSLALDGLVPQTIYYYKVRAYLPNGGGYAYSPIVSFTTTPQGLSPADVTVDPVTDLTTTGATLGATVNLHGSSGIGVIEWGTASGDYTRSAALYYTATSTGRDFYRSLPTQFSPGTIYHYKITVTNATGSVTTGDQTFTTLSPPVPVVTFGAVSPIGPNTATINTTVDTDGAPVTSSSVQWGTTTAYGKSLPLLSGAAQPDGSRIYTRPLISMKPSTVYHYKVTVTTAFGTYESTDRTFTTTP